MEEKGKAAPVEANVWFSANNVLEADFSDRRGILLIAWETFNRCYYCELLEKAKVVYRCMRKNQTVRDVILPHTAATTKWNALHWGSNLEKYATGLFAIPPVKLREVKGPFVIVTVTKTTASAPCSLIEFSIVKPSVVMAKYNDISFHQG